MNTNPGEAPLLSPLPAPASQGEEEDTPRPTLLPLLHWMEEWARERRNIRVHWCPFVVFSSSRRFQSLGQLGVALLQPHLLRQIPLRPALEWILADTSNPTGVLANGTTAIRERQQPGIVQAVVFERRLAFAAGPSTLCLFTTPAFGVVFSRSP